MQQNNPSQQDLPYHALLETSSDLIKSYQAIMEKWFNPQSTQLLENVVQLNETYQTWLSELSPNRYWQSQQRFLKESFAFFQEHGAFLEKKPQPASFDKRFSAADWQHPYFYYLHQSYLFFSQQCLQWVKENPSEPQLNKKIEFFTKQWLDALSPANFLLTNPEVLNHFSQENLTNGFKNWLDDYLRGYPWHINMTDLGAFELGKNIAATPGKVIYQNRLIQLIQYSPLTAQVYERPLFIVPPWINKYYILDLQEKNSLVRWMVSQGLTVFIISWVNPDENHREISFEDYLLDGVIAGLNAIEKATGHRSVNALGFCLGGTLLAAALAYLKAQQDTRIHSATFLATLIDFTQVGDIEVFIDEEQITSLEKKMDEKGYLDGRFLMATFNLLKAKDLIWSYYVNNYLRGKSPLAFDLLYWNSDPTNLPAKMHSFYLRNMYLQNNLIKKGALNIKGTPLDLSTVTTPAYFLSTESDHITPWQSTYLGAQYLKGPLTFVLAGSGHVSGVINPPSNNKYGYKYYDAPTLLEPQAWLAGAKSAAGSWWVHWLQWVKQYSGELTQARHPTQQAIEDAPGSYVKKRLF